MKGVDVMLRTLSMPVVFALLVLGAHFFLRGHDAPGGGFVAGLVVAAAALLSRMARGRPLLRFPARALLPWGLALALLTGVVPMAFGYGFLKSAHGHLTLPGFGSVAWASSLAFDLGVFLVVVGTTLTIIDLLADEDLVAFLGHDRAAASGDGAGDQDEAAG